MTAFITVNVILLEDQKSTRRRIINADRIVQIEDGNEPTRTEERGLIFLDSQNPYLATPLPVKETPEEIVEMIVMANRRSD